MRTLLTWKEMHMYIEVYKSLGSPKAQVRNFIIFTNDWKVQRLLLGQW